MPAPKGNKNAKGNKGGRPRLFKTPEEMQVKIDEYFDKCDGRMIEVYDKRKQQVIEILDPQPYTVEGLTAHLGFGSRRSFLNYRTKEEYVEFFPIVKNAIVRIHQDIIQRGMRGDAPPAFAIFYLCNNSDYVDARRTEISGPDGGPVQQEFKGFEFLPGPDQDKEPKTKKSK